MRILQVMISVLPDKHKMHLTSLAERIAIAKMMNFLVLEGSEGGP